MRKLNYLAEQLKGKTSTKTFKGNQLGSVAFQNMVQGNKVSNIPAIKPLQFRGGSMMQMTDFRKGMQRGSLANMIESSATNSEIESDESIQQVDNQMDIENEVMVEDDPSDQD